MPSHAKHFIKIKTERFDLLVTKETTSFKFSRVIFHDTILKDY